MGNDPLWVVELGVPYVRAAKRIIPKEYKHDFVKILNQGNPTLVTFGIIEARF